MSKRAINAANRKYVDNQYIEMRTNPEKYISVEGEYIICKYYKKFRNTMTLHTKKFDNVEYGIDIAKKFVEYVGAKKREPRWVGTNIHNISIKIHNKEVCLKINKKEGVVDLYSHGRKPKSSFRKQYPLSMLPEVIKIRNLFYILGIRTKKHFKPRLEIIGPMASPLTPVFGKVKKSYVTVDEMYLIHDELLQFIKDFNIINANKTWYKDTKRGLDYPQIPPNTVAAIIKIFNKIKYVNARTIFGQPADDLEALILSDIPSYMVRYDQRKGTPFTFITMIINNIIAKFKLKLKKDYINGTPLPRYTDLMLDAASIDTYLADRDDHDDDHDDNANEVYNTIKKDISKYVDRAAELNMSFDKYLIQCKNQNKII